MRKQIAKRKRFGITNRFRTIKLIMEEAGIEINYERINNQIVPIARTTHRSLYRPVGKTNMAMLAQKIVFDAWNNFPHLRKFMVTKKKSLITSLET